MEVKRRGGKTGAWQGKISTLGGKSPTLLRKSVNIHKNLFLHLLNIVFFNLFKSPLDVI